MCVSRFTHALRESLSGIYSDRARNTRKAPAVTSPSTVLEGVPGALIPGTRFEIELFGATTRYWQYGAGMNTGVFPSECSPKILLIHGFRGDHHGLEIIANRLLKLLPEASIISPDLPGFGRSEDLPMTVSLQGYTAWLHALIGQINPVCPDGSDIHVVGHSFGSIVTAAYAAEYPHGLDRLTLINPISEPALEGSQKIASRAASFYYRVGAALPERLGYPLLRSQLITRVTSELMMRTREPAMRRFINNQHAAYFGSFGSRKGVLQAYEVSISATAAEFAPQIQVPVQMLVAEDDDLGTPQTARAMFAALERRPHSPGERFEIIPEVGHLIHYETPTVAARLIAEFTHEDFTV